MRVHIQKGKDFMVLVFRNETEIVDMLTDLAAYFKRFRGGKEGGFPVAVGFDMGECKLTEEERKVILRQVLNPGQEPPSTTVDDLTRRVV